jgi:hypothetical protein
MSDPIQNSSSIVLFGIPLLAVLAGLLAVLGYGWAGDPRGRARRFAAAGLLLALVLGSSAALGASGILLDLQARPPRPMLMFAFVLGAVGLGLSPVGRRLATGLPLAALVGFQAFRFPLELVMHQAAVERVMPLQMSFSGQNFDILSGLSALVVGVGLASGHLGRRAAMAFNALGIALLLAIVGIAVSSLPLIHAFGEAPERLNTFVLYFPFVWLPTVLVALAALGHVVLTRRLLAPESGPLSSD